MTPIVNGLQTVQDAGLGWLLLGDSMTPQKFIREMAGHVPTNYDSLSPEEQAQVRAQLALSGQRGVAVVLPLPCRPQDPQLHRLPQRLSLL